MSCDDNIDINCGYIIDQSNAPQKFQDSIDHNLATTMKLGSKNTVAFIKLPIFFGHSHRV
tara:strand:+ start:28 stop:207 length:180 start_codon:yes stop_codon:yes gene_type:complete